jgi:ribosomal RNA-processing protein 7
MVKEGGSKRKGGESGGVSGAPSVNGFSVLRVRMAQLPFVHVLYVKPHRSKKHDDGALPCERTLFVANAGIGEAALRTVLSGFGDIERIEMSGAGAQAVTHHGLVQAPHEVASRAPGGDKRGPLHAHVVFKKKRTCEAALECRTIVELAVTSDDGHESAYHSWGSQGVRSWVEEYRSRDVAEEELQASVDAYMAYFDERTEAEKKERKDKVVDDDGFELVTYKRKTHAPDTPEPPKKKKKELVDFYRFQVRDRKRDIAVYLLYWYKISLLSQQALHVAALPKDIDAVFVLTS